MKGWKNSAVALFFCVLAVQGLPKAGAAVISLQMVSTGENIHEFIPETSSSAASAYNYAVFAAQGTSDFEGVTGARISLQLTDLFGRQFAVDTLRTLDHFSIALSLIAVDPGTVFSNISIAFLGESGAVPSLSPFVQYLGNEGGLQIRLGGINDDPISAPFGITGAIITADVVSGSSGNWISVAGGELRAGNDALPTNEDVSPTLSFLSVPEPSAAFLFAAGLAAAFSVRKRG